MSVLAWLVVAAFAAYRVTRLLVIDALFEGTRDRLIARLADGGGLVRSKLLELLLCPYCVGVWVSIGVWVVIATAIDIDATFLEHCVLIAAVAGAQATLQSLNASLENIAHDE